MTNFLLTCDEAIPPFKARESDSGFDLSLIKLLKSENGIDFFTTGVVLIPPPNMWYMLVARSSMAKSGYVLANGVGVIDTEYRGEVIVALRKVGDGKDIELPARWVQVIPQQLLSPTMTQVNSIEETSRGATGGLGSEQFK